MLHHDMRSSLDYSCLKCTHEWQIDPVVATIATAGTLVELGARLLAPSGLGVPSVGSGGKWLVAATFKALVQKCTATVMPHP